MSDNNEYKSIFGDPKEATTMMKAIPEVPMPRPNEGVFPKLSYPTIPAKDGTVPEENTISPINPLSPLESTQDQVRAESDVFPNGRIGFSYASPRPTARKKTGWRDSRPHDIRTMIDGQFVWDSPSESEGEISRRAEELHTSRKQSHDLLSGKLPGLAISPAGMTNVPDVPLGLEPPLTFRYFSAKRGDADRTQTDTYATKARFRPNSPVNKHGLAPSGRRTQFNALFNHSPRNSRRDRLGGRGAVVGRPDLADEPIPRLPTIEIPRVKQLRVTQPDEDRKGFDDLLERLRLGPSTINRIPNDSVPTTSGPQVPRAAVAGEVVTGTPRPRLKFDELFKYNAPNILGLDTPYRRLANQVVFGDPTGKPGVAEEQPVKQQQSKLPTLPPNLPETKKIHDERHVKRTDLTANLRQTCSQNHLERSIENLEKRMKAVETAVLMVDTRTMGIEGMLKELLSLQKGNREDGK